MAKTKKSRSREITEEQIQTHYNKITSAKGTFDRAKSPLETAWKNAEEAGINKAAMKQAIKLLKTDTVHAAAFIRDFNRYAKTLGLMDQIEAFEDDERQEAETLAGDDDDHEDAYGDDGGESAGAHLH